MHETGRGTENRFALWTRNTTRQRWRRVAERPTEADCLWAMDESGIHHGQWITVPVNIDPNTHTYHGSPLA